MTDRDDLAARLQAHGFDESAAYRALVALAGQRIPPSARLQATGRRQTARQLLSGGMSRSEATQAIAERFGISIRQAWRDTSDGL